MNRFSFLWTALCAVSVGIGLQQQLLAEQIFSEDVRIQTTASPRLILDQSGGAFPAQQWEIVGNQDNFAILDTSHGTSPFSIAPDALPFSLFIDSTSKIGLGTAGPVADLHLASNYLATTFRMQNFSSSAKWEMSIDGSGFTLSDISAATVPFNLQPGVPTNTLFLASGGNIGVGTSTPLQRLHVVDDITIPTLRLDDTSGNPGTWDITGGGTGFDVWDAVANTNPLTILPGAPTNSLRVAATGHIGIGTASPASKIHVHKLAESNISEQIARFSVSDDAIGKLLIANASSSDGVYIPKIQGASGSQNAALIMDGLITNDVGVSPAIVYNAATTSGGALTTRPLVVYRNNNVAKVTIKADGHVTATAFDVVSSRTLKSNITSLESHAASQALRQLTPVEFVYRDDLHAEKQVGFIAEDVPEIVANVDRKSVPVMDILAVVTRVVKDQQQANDEQTRTIAEQHQLIMAQQKSNDLQNQLNQDQAKVISDLLKRLDRLESRN